jgi:hypothetical protein
MMLGRLMIRQNDIYKAVMRTGMVHTGTSSSSTPISQNCISSSRKTRSEEEEYKMTYDLRRYTDQGIPKYRRVTLGAAHRLHVYAAALVANAELTACG